jgi:transcriptional regulator with XRE-family HTH domain
MQQEKSTHPLKKARLQLGYTQKLLADFAQVGEATIQRAENGKPLRPDSIQRLCSYFSERHQRQVTPQELGLVPNEKDTLETLPNGSIIPTIFDSETEDKLDHAESLIDLAWEAWFASRPKEAARSVSRLLPSLEKIAHSPHRSGHTLRAKELTIRAHGLLGTICLDALQNETSFFHYMQAYQFAEEIHDIDLSATYLCLLGDVLRRQNNQAGALKYMENARDLASNASNTTRGHILQLLAYTYGDTGQEAEFERTISEATDLLAFSGEGIDTTKKEFIPFEIYEIRGKVNRDLGKPLNAVPYLELAEKSLTRANSVTPRWHALLEISRAQAFCDAGDITTGIELACKGFIMAYQCHSSRQMNRVRKLLRKLEKGPNQNHPKVQDLKNLLYETYIHMDSEDSPASPFHSPF